MQKETHVRTLVKTILWRVIATSVSFSIVYFFTGKLAESADIAIVGALIAMVAYYLHERFWNAVQWGRVEK